ncbi:MAG TPA: SDR family NAD(P)-dependent oxidoreductase [Longimicrobiales bacterium]|nr:SDR family NAD(P)-dependent oxidoreductase [Longimicrobiales bacterium]
MDRLIDLRGRAALVTGASRGIGRATALLLARAGASVGVAYRARSGAAEAVAGECRALGVHAWTQAGDLGRAADCKALLARAERETGGLDILVVNHGVWPPQPVALADLTEERWHATLAENLHSVFHLCRAAVPRMRNGGRIVLVSSTAGQRGEAYHGDYAAAKGALISLVKGWCVELGPRGITVNAVAPGWVDTEMSESVLASAERARIEGAIPLGRVASAEDVAGPIVFLCSDLARHVTGEVLNVNGGSVLVG